jgi:hypothetical protein
MVDPAWRLLLLLLLLHVRELTALVFIYLCRGWHITHHPYDASKSKKKKKGEIRFQQCHTCYLLEGGLGDGRDHWLDGVAPIIPMHLAELYEHERNHITPSKTLIVHADSLGN